MGREPMGRELMGGIWGLIIRVADSLIVLWPTTTMTMTKVNN